MLSSLRRSQFTRSLTLSTFRKSPIQNYNPCISNVRYITSVSYRQLKTKHIRLSYPIQSTSISKSLCSTSSQSNTNNNGKRLNLSFAAKYLYIPGLITIASLFLFRDKLLTWATIQIFERREQFLWNCYPDRIILIRHGQSESNMDQKLLSDVPDHEIPLTQKGRDQAIHAGEKLKELIGDEDLYAYYSPYKRAQETLHGILVGGRLTNQTKIQIEDVRLIEQKFGNHQDFEAIRIEKAARMKYGRYFYQFKEGESALDVTLRATAFSDRLFDHFRTGYYSTRPDRHWNVLVVSHGLFMRVFLKSFLRKTVDEFSQWYNYANCEMCVLEKGKNGIYHISCGTPLPTTPMKRLHMND